MGALLCFAIHPANAQVLASNDTRTEFPPDNTLRVEVRGTIEPRCGISFNAEHVRFDLGTLNDSDRGGTSTSTRSLPFQIECNQPFTYSLVAEHGVLRNETQDSGDEHFRREVAYRANIAGAGTTAAQRQCDSVALSQTNGCLFSVSAASTRGVGALEISWDQDPRPLLQGEYHDQLRVVVQPNLTGGD